MTGDDHVSMSLLIRPCEHLRRQQQRSAPLSGCYSPQSLQAALQVLFVDAQQVQKVLVGLRRNCSIVEFALERCAVA